MNEYVWKPIAPLTRIGVLKDTRNVVIISHEFPEAFEFVTVNNFVNTAQGFVCTNLTLPATDALALATLIKEDVPEGSPVDDPFSQADAKVDDTGVSVTIGIMRRLTEEERTRTEPWSTFILEKRDGMCRVLVTMSFTKAHMITEAIEGIAAEITRRLAELLPEPQRAP